jgi:hypothetical protein
MKSILAAFFLMSSAASAANVYFQAEVMVHDSFDCRAEHMASVVRYLSIDAKDDLDARAQFQRAQGTGRLCPVFSRCPRHDSGA